MYVSTSATLRTISNLPAGTFFGERRNTQKTEQAAMSFEIRAALSDFSGFTAQAGVLAITLTFLALLVRRAVFTPLRHVPVPFLCRVSDLPAIIMAFRGRKALWTHSLFLKYGPLVRTGPATVSCKRVTS